MQRNWRPVHRRRDGAAPVAAALLLLAGFAAGCGTPAPPPQTGPVKTTAGAASPAQQPEAPVPSTAPKSVPIGQLAPDTEREVRIAGVVEQILGMRLVPAKVIFKVRDNTGSVTAVINEQTELSEGQRIELVGVYKAIPAPMHAGPGEGPEEPVFVVDRFIVF